MKGCGNKLLSISTGRNLRLPRVHLERFMMTEGRIALSRFPHSTRLFAFTLTTMHWFHRFFMPREHSRQASSPGISNDFFPFPSTCCRRTTYFVAIATDCKSRHLNVTPSILLSPSKIKKWRYVFILCAGWNNRFFFKYKINPSPYSACEKSVCVFLR